MPRPEKRSFTIGGHRTSISLEGAFWEALREIAGREKSSMSQLVQKVDDGRHPDAGLSSAVRVWILDYYRKGQPKK
ncbi:MAG: ribbon-helix-helix domain-containing protein [Hyphomicrobiaceae bacterium]